MKSLNERVINLLLRVPTKEEWNEIATTFPVGKLQVNVNDFQSSVSQSIAPRHIFKEIETMHWARHLQHRIADVWTSYIMVMFYYNMGIPDDEWSVAGERGGIKYFPHFEARHYDIKAQFDYYTDIFYYKMFSVLDTIGHLLFVMYELELKGKERPSFASAVNKLKDIRPNLHNGLSSIMKQPDFTIARRFRNDITHNFQPNTLGSSVRLVNKNMITFGGADYVPSSAFKENVFQSLHLIVKILEIIKQQKP